MVTTFETPPYSLLIITSGRDLHLQRTIAGVLAMDEAPNEIVVAYMNQPDEADLGEAAIVSLHVDSGERLPLARARNAAARRAQYEHLVFLDVDCIPATDFATIVLCDQSLHPGLVMATPLYLPADFDASGSCPSGVATVHPLRADLPIGEPADYNLFWSLCFAITKTDFERVGGFDETLVGYGAEDTDFAWSAREHGIPFTLSRAQVLHQHHDSYQPPINHFDDIVSNASRFYEKWKEWPMSGWLRAFAELSLVNWNPDATTIDVLRRPTAEQIADVRVTT